MSASSEFGLKIKIPIPYTSCVLDFYFYFLVMYFMDIGFLL